MPWTVSNANFGAGDADGGGASCAQAGRNGNRPAAPAAALTIRNLRRPRAWRGVEWVIRLSASRVQHIEHIRTPFSPHAFVKKGWQRLWRARGKTMAGSRSSVPGTGTTSFATPHA